MPLRELLIVCALMTAVIGGPASKLIGQHLINVDASGRPLISDQRRTNDYFTSNRKITPEDIKSYRKDYPLIGIFVDSPVEMRMNHSHLIDDSENSELHDDRYSSLEELSEL